MEYLDYKKFYEQEQAEALAALLQKHAIDFQVSEDRDSLDTLYGDNHFKKVYFIKLKGSSFEVVNDLLLKESSSAAVDDDPDHYLHSFTNDELFEILSRPDEWSSLDYQLSKQILAARGIDISQPAIELLKRNRLQELSKPEESQPVWIYVGYIFAILGGIIGVFIGWHLQSYKKTLPDGRKVYGYKTEDRKHGIRILILGVLMFLTYTIVRIYSLD